MPATDNERAALIMRTTTAISRLQNCVAYLSMRTPQTDLRALAEANEARQHAESLVAAIQQEIID